jgi:hypothetical protein
MKSVRIEFSLTNCNVKECGICIIDGGLGLFLRQGSELFGYFMFLYKYDVLL